MSGTNPGVFEWINPEQRFDQSAVIGFVKSDLEDYASYGVDFVSWGGYPRQQTEKSIVRFREHIISALNQGTQFGVKIGTRTCFRQFIDYAGSDCLDAVVLDVSGDPLMAPNKEGITYKGYPPYWFCTNNPVFRAFLKANIKRGLSFKPVGFMMDDPLGTAQTLTRGKKSGCYCAHCVKGFRDYLNRNYSKSQLREMGISEPETFNIRSFHQAYKDRYPSRRPLFEQYHKYQVQSAALLFEELVNYAKNISGKDIHISGNISPLSCSASSLSQFINYYSCEIDLKADTETLDDSLGFFAYKMADASNKQAVIMGSGKDHAIVAEKGLDNLLKSWVAEAYANGHFFMAPYRLWALSGSKGPYWYNAPHHVSLLFQFIKKHPYLFSGYDTLAAVGFFIDLGRACRTKTIMKLNDSVQEVANYNIPFELVPVNPNMGKKQFREKLAKSYKLLLSDPGFIFSSGQKKILESFEQQGSSILDTVEMLPGDLKIATEPAKGIRVFIRISDATTDSPFIVHILNRDYKEDKRGFEIKTNVKVTIPYRLISDYVPDPEQLIEIRYFMPNSEEIPEIYSSNKDNSSAYQSIPILKNSNSISFVLPKLSYWGIAQVKCAGT